MVPDLMIAKMPTLAAMAYKYSVGQPFVYPKNDLDYATNFLRMCFAVPAEEWPQSGARPRDGPHLHPARQPRKNASALDGAARRLDRGQSAARVAAGIAALWGRAWRR